ncbi:MAG TPA: ACP phosphodiesterase [Chitinophagaceae bacterium]|nr:ACP phosphodiesterase [Chitinophagaceae bacterium]
MNYLAHAYLSFNRPGILAGNMISDFVKGKKKFDYPPYVQHGIQLHRFIDSFTDDHEATRQAKKVFKPFVGLYAGAFVDVAYDHFLANDEQEFSAESLAAFAAYTYNILDSFQNILPEKFTLMFPYMRRQNWLYNYRTVEGIKNSFVGVVRRAAYLNSSADVFDAFLNHYYALQYYYTQFFPQLKAFANETLEKLTAGS